ncbi:MAG: hypothetical protein M1825_004444 [Sarcosagium campestre]|nr:MAG: hypothetical protein M1825_004444 [Sarcosagium campestre]
MPAKRKLHESPTPSPLLPSPTDLTAKSDIIAADPSSCKRTPTTAESPTTDRSPTAQAVGSAKRPLPDQPHSEYNRSSRDPLPGISPQSTVQGLDARLEELLSERNRLSTLLQYVHLPFGIKGYIHVQDTKYSRKSLLVIYDAMLMRLDRKRREKEKNSKVPTDVAMLANKRSIARLRAYNDIRDVGTGLLGMVAEQRGVRIGDVFDEFGVGRTD